MLGINSSNSDWKVHAGNFLITLVAQMVFGLVQNVSQTQMPTSTQFFWAIINAATVTFLFYGVNKLDHKQENGSG